MKQNTFELEFWSKVKKTPGCWWWNGAKSGKYGRFKYVTAQRVAYMLTYEDFDPQLEVLHKCDKPLCVRPDHLFQGTIQDNMADMVRKGRQAKGERVGIARLNWEKVREIRANYPQKSVGYFMRKFQVSRWAVKSVIQGWTWKE